LGLLSPGGEFTAIEIEQRAYRYLRFFYWTPALSHIRRELDRLEELGYVDCREVMTGRIKRTLKYWLTPSGVAALKEWAEDTPAERTVKKNPAILRLWLGRRGADPSTVLDGLEGHIEYVRSERQALIDFIVQSEADYEDRASEMDEVSGPAREELRVALWRHEWLKGVMRYCLRDYDNEVKNLEQLMADMRRLGDEKDSFVPEGMNMPSRPVGGADGGRGSGPTGDRSS
jgi:DNA-binding PadR family transcriptional regulator